MFITVNRKYKNQTLIRTKPDSRPVLEVTQRLSWPQHARDGWQLALLWQEQSVLVQDGNIRAQLSPGALAQSHHTLLTHTGSSTEGSTSKAASQCVCNWAAGTHTQKWTSWRAKGLPCSGRHSITHSSKSSTWSNRPVHVRYLTLNC